MNDDIKDLLPSSSTINKVTPLVAGGALAFFFGMPWLAIPLVLAFFFPSFFRIIYSVFLFVILGTFFTGLVFILTTTMSWLPFSFATWWRIAHWLYVPTIFLSLYLAKDVDSFSNP